MFGVLWDEYDGGSSIPSLDGLSERVALQRRKTLFWSTHGRLYARPTMIVVWLHRLDLNRVLGGAERQERLQALLDLHEAINWLRVPYSQGHHFDNSRSLHHSPGRMYDAGRADRGSGPDLSLSRTPNIYGP